MANIPQAHHSISFHYFFILVGVMLNHFTDVYHVIVNVNPLARYHGYYYRELKSRVIKYNYQRHTLLPLVSLTRKIPHHKSAR